MKNYFEEIKKKLINNIKLEKLEIIDNSELHKSHKFFNPGRYHIKLKIKSPYLNSLPRIAAQKEIMRVLDKDLKTKIHAIEISIEQ